MKKILMAAGALACVGLGGGVVAIASGSSPAPEIDRASANLQLQGKMTSKTCAGEDSIRYVTFTGAYAGGESQVLPDPTDYSLTGSVEISGFGWTINLKTDRGVLNGAITLSNSAGSPVYKGRIILVTQGLPAAGAKVPGRGFIVANFQGPDDGVKPPNHDYLVANTEFYLTQTSAIGEFGDATSNFGFKDYSAVTNTAPVVYGTC
jgi:hypothetical protein